MHVLLEFFTSISDEARGAFLVGGLTFFLLLAQHRLLDLLAMQMSFLHFHARAV